MKTRRRTYLRSASLTIGTSVTALGCALILFSFYDGLNDAGFDFLCRNFSYLQAHPDIALVDIDDGSLQSPGEWPWPRRRYAQLISTLSDAGAKAIVLDILLTDPTPPRRIHAGYGPHYDIDPPQVVLGDATKDPFIFDDDELRDAIQKAGNVYLSMYFPLLQQELDPYQLQAYADSTVEEDPAISRTKFDQKMVKRFRVLLESETTNKINYDQLYDVARLRLKLLTNFKLSETQLVNTLDQLGPDPTSRIEHLLPDVKQSIARTLSIRFVKKNPTGTFTKFLENALPQSQSDTISPERVLLRTAYREAKSWLALVRMHPPTAKSLLGNIPNGGKLTLPLEKFAQVAKGVGFVTFDRESTGAVVREIPLIANANGLQVPQLAFLVAADQLGFDRSTIDLRQNQLMLFSLDGEKSWPISSQGQTPINWHYPRGSGDWRDGFLHIPAIRILEPALNREVMADNEKIYRLTLARLVLLRHTETAADYADYVKHINRRLEIQENLNRKKNIVEATAKELAELEQAITTVEEEALIWLDRRKQLYEPYQPTTEKERIERQEILSLHTDLRGGRLSKRVVKIKKRLTQRNADLAKEMSQRFKDKICIVGYTASGSGDLVSSPVYRSLPGAMVHANALNMLLYQAPLKRETPNVIALILVLAGAAITLTTTSLRPLTSLLILLIFIAANSILEIILFKTVGYTNGSITVSIHVCLVWACVAVYRQFTEERARRRFHHALAQYTSPAVAAQIAESGAKEDLAPQAATVTCFFSDLYGFTNLSERLGAEKTRLVLNPYLRAMSQVLIDRGAILNKFIGDGIFAFFNAPIRPSLQHPTVACDSALASLRALSTLHLPQALVGDPLRMRIGLSTGEAFVGDYGSDTKLDYTCIGDTVNVGARLERLNKSWGTNILTDETTRRQAGDQFIFRALGRVHVAGKSHPVAIYELVDYAAKTPPSDQEYFTTFEKLVRCYQDRDWENCSRELDHCLSIHNDDPALIMYRQAINHYRVTPPPSDWDKTVPVL